MMLRGKLANLSPLKLPTPRPLQHPRPPSFSSTPSEQAGISSSSSSKQSWFARKAVQMALISLTGAVAVSAANDLAIFHGCSSKAIEIANKNQKIIESLGGPIVRGSWYDASLAVSYRRNTVSCTFPVSGPQGSGSLRLKAVRNGEDTWFSLLHHDWDILMMDALVHVPSNDEKHRTFRVCLTDNTAPVDCKDCRNAVTEPKK